LYPDSGHGALFQYAELFISEVNYFLGNSKTGYSNNKKETKYYYDCF